MVKTMQNGATQDKKESYPCNVTAESMQQFRPKGAYLTTMLKVNDLLSSEECAPIKLPSIPTSFGAATSTLKDNAKPPPDKVKGTIVITWANVDLKIGLRLTVATNEMKPYTGYLGDTDPGTIAVECVSSEKIAGEDRFQAPCKCLKKTKFLTSVVVQVIDVLMPCFCSMGLEQMAGNVTDAKEVAKTVFNEMSCKEFYCT